MYCTCLSAALLSIISIVLLTPPTARASPAESKVASHDVTSMEGDLGHLEEDPDLIKRLSNFVRIGRPSSQFVRIGKGSHFVRIGRPGNFVRIGRSSLEDENTSDPYPETDDEMDAEKRASRFVRIGKASRFVRIGRGDNDDDKRMSSFVRIGKADGSSLDEDVEESVEDPEKRASSHFVRIGRIPSSAFVRIGKIPASAFVRIGRKPGQTMSGEEGDFSNFDRISRMGQSSFVRIGKRAAPESQQQAAASQQNGAAEGAAPSGQ